MSRLGLTPDQLSQVPTMSRALYDALPVDSEFPVLSADLNGQLKVVDMQDNPTTCWWWERTAGEGRPVSTWCRRPRFPWRRPK
ncbi:hypothetical protein I553_9875 [Mycobacterium xenopi 4042]|uniref:Uncharacterized protein n=1 Tax=Mycobacterium xenopi 4042 TaxID=1299334 RepID=X7YQR8_MYCXE|nr:hypothetical protein I553_9875 [Mycobacterium xenopi 4042]